jgi:hypothetical protein
LLYPSLCFFLYSSFSFCLPLYFFHHFFLFFSNYKCSLTLFTLFTTSVHFIFQYRSMLCTFICVFVIHFIFIRYRAYLDRTKDSEFKLKIIVDLITLFLRLIHGFYPFQC